VALVLVMLSFRAVETQKEQLEGGGFQAIEKVQTGRRSREKIYGMEKQCGRKGAWLRRKQLLGLLLGSVASFLDAPT
jgi:hypothetical protein